MDAVFKIIANANLTLPALEVFLLIGFLNLALLFRLPRCGMIAAYIVVYRWCWPTVNSLPETARYFYIGFGVFAAILAIYETLNER